MMKVPQLSPSVGKEEYAAIKACFDNNWITEGPKAKEFVDRILKLTGSKYGVLAPNGTLALYLGLRALGIGPGDEVIVPDFTFYASATSVEMTGATPVFCDVNKRNFQIDVSSAEKRITKSTKAVMPVHIYGTVSNMDEVLNFAKKHHLLVIEDAAEALDVRWKGKCAGTFGDVGCISFFADKTITTAEGGIVLTDKKTIFEKLLFLRNQGRINRGSFIHPGIGYNFRMTDIQCAVGLAQLDKLEEIKLKKLGNLKLYQKLLSNVPGVTFFEPDEDAEFLPFRVGILYRHARELMVFLKEKGIEPRTFFYPLHSQPAFSSLKKRYGYKEDDFQNSKYGFECGVCLPVFPSLTRRQIGYVCQVIREFVEGKSKIYYQYYDSFFKNKDYEGEAETVLDLSKANGVVKVDNLLEVGCGTGNHTVFLAKKARHVAAVDIDREMVKQARRKMALKKIRNVRLFDTGLTGVTRGRFDLAVALFNVVTYVPTLNELDKFFLQVASKIRSGGLFIFDSWNGIAAIKDQPKAKTSEVQVGTKKILCSTIPKIDLFNQKVELGYEFRVMRGRKIIETGETSMNQSLWTPAEIGKSCVAAGLALVGVYPLMDTSRAASAEDWKIMYVVRKAW